jgi:hypothetical protein
MLYFQHNLLPFAHRLARVDVCHLDTVAERDVAHAADEIQAALSSVPVRLVRPAEVEVVGGGQLLVWPVADVERPGPLPPSVREVVERGGFAGLLDPRRRDLAVIRPHGYAGWLWRVWRIRAAELFIRLAGRLGLERRLGLEP